MRIDGLLDAPSFKFMLRLPKWTLAPLGHAIALFGDATINITNENKTEHNKPTEQVTTVAVNVCNLKPFVVFPFSINWDARKTGKRLTYLLTLNIVGRIMNSIIVQCSIDAEQSYKNNMHTMVGRRLPICFIFHYQWSEELLSTDHLSIVVRECQCAEAQNVLERDIRHSKVSYGVDEQRQ